MSIYGDLGLNVQQNITIDKVYSSLNALNDANVPGEKDDGIFIGRFVQINNDTALTADDNLTVWRKVSYGEYQLFANYNVKLPTIELDDDSLDFGENPELTFNSETEHYYLKLPKLTYLDETIDFSYSDGDTNTATLEKISSEDNVIAYQLKLQIDAIGKTIASYNEYFQNSPGADNGKVVEKYNELIASYNEYFQNPPDANNGKVVEKYNDFVDKYNELVEDYEDYFNGDTGKVVKDYKTYFDAITGKVPEEYNKLVEDYEDYFDEETGKVVKDYEDYFDEETGKVVKDYEDYFDEETGSIGSFTGWKTKQAVDIDSGLITEGDKHYLLFPYQDPEDGIWKTSKIDLNKALLIINSTINIEDSISGTNKTLVIG